MKLKIAVVSNTHLLPEAQEEIRRLADGPVVFPEDDPADEAELIRRTGDAEAVIASLGAKITASYLDACPGIKYVGLSGTSTANVDLKALAERKIAFTNVVDYGDEPTAEFIFMQLVTLARGMGKYQWREAPCELMGKSIGIIGLGALGKAIAHLALAYKMDARYYSAHRKPEWEERGLKYAEKAELVSASDIVIISSPTGVQVLGAPEFAAMKTGAILLQASMGEVFDKEAFREWIARDGNYAIFDPSAGEENLQLFRETPRVIIANVYGGYSIEAIERLGRRVVEQLSKQAPPARPV